MPEIGIGPDLVRGAGLLYLCVFVLLLVVILKLKIKKPRRLMWILLLVAVFIGPMVPHTLRSLGNEHSLAVATAVFKERCQSAGEKILRTVSGVKGVSLINIRPEQTDRSDQFARSDPYGWDGGGKEYLKSYLPGYWKWCAGVQCPPERRAFDYVEIDPQGRKERFGTISKATGQPLQAGELTIPELTPTPVAGLPTLYGVKWEDISTDEDRRLWIAGGKISIVHLPSQEVIATRVGYLIDTGQGSRDGFRQPWAWARMHGNACPPVEGHNSIFARKVLTP
ncbi:hypothetical protein [Caenimonas aquaedulcis]|uniref:Uncharacterized protein n=1 Tax=Caenimonas aquaedulcis TaxID=2793270 RepID=A0A931H663_9BURK|nr:hypothetical protein [Caenimonas aquaedulcis]MBG9389187.1 hypothetical protein [Caenimonas aquaedulcis]